MSAILDSLKPGMLLVFQGGRDGHHDIYGISIEVARRFLFNRTTGPVFTPVSSVLLREDHAMILKEVIESSPDSAQVSEGFPIVGINLLHGEKCGWMFWFKHDFERYLRTGIIKAVAP